MPRPRPLPPALALALGLLGCSELAPPPKPLSSFGQPLPTASTTAEPLWLRSGVAPAPASERPEGPAAASSRPAER
ncbi:MAG TPA: hypothetical protein VFS43_34915 [Polyangiaceae bacterium]|nr:hypothetical protein [Polyangiaceae bacterium]